MPPAHHFYTTNTFASVEEVHAISVWPGVHCKRKELEQDASTVANTWFDSIYRVREPNIAIIKFYNILEKEGRLGVITVPPCNPKVTELSDHVVRDKSLRTQ
jgi:hypothetical protein